MNEKSSIVSLMKQDDSIMDSLKKENSRYTKKQSNSPSIDQSGVSFRKKTPVLKFSRNDVSGSPKNMSLHDKTKRSSAQSDSKSLKGTKNIIKTYDRIKNQNFSNPDLIDITPKINYTKMPSGNISNDSDSTPQQSKSIRQHTKELVTPKRPLKSASLSEDKKGMFEARSKLSNTQITTGKLSLNERIFWSKEQIESLRERFKITLQKIKIKTNEDFDQLFKDIMNGEQEKVLALMHDIDFKTFYEMELSKREILEYILKEGKPEMLMEVLKDKFYKFNNKFVFEFIVNLIRVDKKNDLSESYFSNQRSRISERSDSHHRFIHNQNKVNEIITNIIKYDLYETADDLVILFAWFVGNFEFTDAFM